MGISWQALRQHQYQVARTFVGEERPSEAAERATAVNTIERSCAIPRATGRPASSEPSNAPTERGEARGAGIALVVRIDVPMPMAGMPMSCVAV
jgi:hypothetical protein